MAGMFKRPDFPSGLSGGTATGRFNSRVNIIYLLMYVLFFSMLLQAT